MNVITETMAVPAAIGGSFVCMGSAGNFVLDLIDLRAAVTREHLVYAGTALLLALTSGWMSVVAWTVATR